jgi:UDP-N-acetylglucosamine transferase subunit ALG13
VIFVTVGTQLPFERLVAAVDRWAASISPGPDVLAQVGGGHDDYANLRCVRTLDGHRYSEAIANSRLMIAHAGTGSILTALDRGVPVILMPRDHRRGEHRDDHQYQTARQLEKMGLLTVAWDESELPELIEKALRGPGRRPRAQARGAELIGFVRNYILGVLGSPSET